MLELMGSPTIFTTNFIKLKHSMFSLFLHIYLQQITVQFHKNISGKEGTERWLGSLKQVIYSFDPVLDCLLGQIEIAPRPSMAIVPV